MVRFHPGGSESAVSCSSTINYMVSCSVFVVVQFYPWFNFYFLFWGVMVMYDKEFKTKK